MIQREPGAASGSVARHPALLKKAQRRASQLHHAGRYEDALGVCLAMARVHPRLASIWTHASANCVRLSLWDKAIEYGERALSLGDDSLALADALAHAYCARCEWEAVRRHGLAALTQRDAVFGQPAQLAPHALPALPPAPSAATREHNVIAFSLFGGNAKYCEPAILNALEQPAIYPHWVCRFYVDDTVPTSVIGRIRDAGGQVVLVADCKRAWPGPMWRLLALGDPSLHRILFRDADSVISRREALAVDQWVRSDRHFHAMRDSGSHTELLLAGLWGLVQGALPPLSSMTRPFFAVPLTSQRFADQYFLRQQVWPYARQSLLQHDSMFGFLGGLQFPDGPRPEDFHVGCAEGAPFFTLKCALPDASVVHWNLYRSSAVPGQAEHLVCRYPATVRAGQVQANLPARYARWVEQGLARIAISSDQEQPC